MGQDGWRILIADANEREISPGQGPDPVSTLGKQAAIWIVQSCEKVTLIWILVWWGFRAAEGLMINQAVGF